MSRSLLALFLAAFGFGTTEFIISGLLPTVAGDLGVSVPTAGLLVTSFAVGGGVGGPILTVLTGRLRRKDALLCVVGVFVVAHVIAGLAPDYLILMMARALAGASWGAYFGIAGVIASNIVAEGRQARAIAMVGAGVAVANLVGVPGATALGQALGWRTSLWLIGAIGIVAGSAVATWVPAGASGDSGAFDLRREVRMLGRQQVFTALLANVLLCISFFGVFTYMVAFLTNVSGLATVAVPGLLLVFGLGATLGVLAGGHIGDWRLMPSIIGLFLAQSVVYGLMAATARTAWAMGLMLFLMAGTGFAVTAPLQARILRAAADSPNLASSLAQTAFNAGIALGAWIGALWLSHGPGYAALPWLGFTFALGGATVAALSSVLDRFGAVANQTDGRSAGREVARVPTHGTEE